MFDFRFNTHSDSLIQGQGSVFKLRECNQSIPRIQLALIKFEKIKKKFRFFSIFFNFLYFFTFLNQDRGSIFKLRECAQSISRIKLPIHGSFLVKKFSSQKIFSAPKIKWNFEKLKTFLTTQYFLQTPISF